MFDFQLLTQFHFMRPEWLLLLIPVGLVMYFKYKQTKDNDAWEESLPPHLLDALNLSESGWRTQLPLKIVILVTVLAVVVSAGVTWKKIPSPFGEDKAPLVIVLDNTESMLQTDLPPSRLERAKQKISDLIGLRDGGKTALIAYAGSSHLVMPLTEDIEVFKPLLKAVTPKIMPRGGKFAETALPLISEILESTDSPVTVLLITDGLGDATLDEFNKVFSEVNDQLLVWGAGNPDRPADIAFEEGKLKQLASSSGGYYQRVSVDDSDIRYLNSKIESHMQLSTDNAMPWDDTGYYLVFVMAFFVLFWFRRGWLVQWCIVGTLTMGLLAPAPVQASEGNRFWDLWLTPDQQGQFAYNREMYVEASEAFEDPMWKALAFYKAKDFKSAHTYFMRVNSPDALIYAANALARSREYVAARSLYDEILKQDPDNEDVKFNRDLVHKIIEETNQFSESQKNTGEMEASNELGDEPQTSEGAEEETTQELMIQEEISAEEILQDESMNEKWMQRVQSNPSVFLRNKFSSQLNQAEVTQ